MQHCADERQPITLPRVPGVEAGRGYITIEVKREEDGRGQHMRLKIKRRRVRRVV